MISQPKYITDSQIVDWCIRGVIVINNIRSRQPEMLWRGTRITPNRHGRQNSRLRWEITYAGKKRTITCHKLVWMYAHQQRIPVDFDVHHDDLDHTNNSIDNLSLIRTDLHPELHRQARRKEVA